MNPLQRLARNPAAYRRLVLDGRPVAESLEAVLRFATGGRRGVLDLAGLPNVRITTSGRKTGLARTATVQYVPVEGGLLLVGSNWGRERHPSWSANLKATQRVTVRRRGERFRRNGAAAQRRGARRGVVDGAGALAELSGSPGTRGAAAVPAVSPHAHRVGAPTPLTRVVGLFQVGDFAAPNRLGPSIAHAVDLDRR